MSQNIVNITSHPSVIEIVSNKTNIELNPNAIINITSTTTNTLDSGDFELGKAVKPFSIVALIDGLLYTASNQNIEHISSVVGIAQSGGEKGDFINVFTDGIITNNGWSWNSQNNNRLFLGSGGAIDTIPDFNAAFMLDIGTVVSRTKIVLDIQEPTLLENKK